MCVSGAISAVVVVGRGLELLGVARFLCQADRSCHEG
jgi:hypothetical protein